MKQFEETAQSITLHGLGFLQVKLPDKARLHVWHPDLPRRKCFAHSSIHDHRFGFISRVLVGTQVNKVYRVWPVNIGGTHISYLHEGPRTEFGNRPWIQDEMLIVELDYEQHIGPGDDYFMQPFVYHATEAGGDGRVATLMTKTIERSRGAHSLCAAGVEPDADFDRKQWPEDRLWEIVRDVLGGAA